MAAPSRTSTTTVQLMGLRYTSSITTPYAPSIVGVRGRPSPANRRIRQILHKYASVFAFVAAEIRQAVSAAIMVITMCSPTIAPTLFSTISLHTNMNGQLHHGPVPATAVITSRPVKDRCVHPNERKRRALPLKTRCSTAKDVIYRCRPCSRSQQGSGGALKCKQYVRVATSI